jgi:hypothetical protein
MIKSINEIINQLAQKPKKLFLVDAIGAMLTTIFLVLILINFNHYFGMSKTTLSYLSLFAGFLFVYSTTCFFFLKKNWTIYIRVISTANLLYCLLTLGLMIFNNDTVTIIGMIYFLIEVAIIFGLVYFEFKVANAIKLNRTGNNITQV